MDGADCRFIVILCGKGFFLGFHSCWPNAPMTSTGFQIKSPSPAKSSRAILARIWVHHAPPAGSPVCWMGRKFGGDEFLLGWIQRFAPDIVLSGHIHNSPFYTEGSIVS